MNYSTGMYLILDVFISLSGLPFLFPKCWCDFVSRISMGPSTDYTTFASKAQFLQKYIKHTMKVLEIVLNRKVSFLFFCRDGRSGGVGKEECGHHFHPELFSKKKQQTSVCKLRCLLCVNSTSPKEQKKSHFQKNFAFIL